MRTRVILLLAAVSAAACKGDSKPAGGTKAGPEPAAPGKPVDKATFDQIARLPYGDAAKVEVQNSNDSSIEMKISYDQTKPKMAATFDVSRCLKCVEIALPKWEARKDELRALEDDDIAQQPDTVFELGEATVAGRKVIYTHTAGVKVDPGRSYMNAHNYALYWNDGVNQIRIRVKDNGLPTAATVQDLVARLSKEQLAEVAADLFTKVVDALPAK